MTKTSHPGKVRVSPGVYRPAKGGSILSKNSKSSKKTINTRGGTYTGLDKAQSKNIDQRTKADTFLGNAANKHLQGVEDAYATPFDYDALPAAPVTGDYNHWVDSQMGNYNKAFDERNNPVFKQQEVDFEQQMANRGIPMGSELYNKQKTLMSQGQNDARTQAYAANQGQAVQSAQALYGVGTDARNQAYTYAQAKRNQPAADFNALYGMQSGFNTPNLGYSQQRDLNERQGEIARSMPRGGGGGGGGAPQLPFDINTDPSYQRWLAQQQFNKANQPKGPSVGAQFVGGLLGSFGNAAASSYGSSLFSTK